MKTVKKQVSLNRKIRCREKGSTLLESLLAVFIFSTAVIGALGLIMSGSQTSGDLKMRMEAANLAEDLIGRMQGDMGGTITNLSNYDDSVTATNLIPANKKQWLSNVSQTLPQSNAQVSVVNNYAGGLASDVKIVISWTVQGENRVYTLTTALTPNQ